VLQMSYDDELAIYMNNVTEYSISESQYTVLKEFADWLDTRSPTLREAETPIPAARYCSECKALLEDRSVYCDVCGTDAPLP